MDSKTIKELWKQLADQQLANNFAATKFNGYHQFEGSGTVKALFDSKGQEITELTGVGFVLFDQTVFYALGGGQPSDYGKLIVNGNEITVYDLNKQIIPNCYLHLVDCHQYLLKLNDECEQFIDVNHRLKLTRNHSAQHLLWSALDTVTKSGIEERSVGISEDKFYIELFKNPGLTLENILQARDLLQSWITANIKSQEIFMTLAEAQAQKIISRDFKYQDNVRVVKFGDVSQDLCGGTHVDATGDLECLEILEIKFENRITIYATANYDELQKYFTEKFNSYQELITNTLAKIKNLQPNYQFDHTMVKLPTTYETLLDLITITNQLKDDLKEIDKEHQKQLQELANTIKLDLISKITPKKISFNEYYLDNTMISNQLIRPRLINLAKAETNTILAYYNRGLAPNLLLFINEQLKDHINLRDLFNNLKEQYHLTGGGTNLFLDVKTDTWDNINNFIASLIEIL